MVGITATSLSVAWLLGKSRRIKRNQLQLHRIAGGALWCIVLLLNREMFLKTNICLIL